MVLDQAQFSKTVFNGIIEVEDIRVNYHGYTIKPKRDMGSRPWIVNGKSVNHGFVVTPEGVDLINVMPGATWFQSVDDAKQAIDVLIEVGEDGKVFWEKLRALKDSKVQ